MIRSTYVGYWLVQQLAERLPNRTAMGWAERLADVQWRHSTADRQAVQANLSWVLDRPIAEDAPLVQAVFRNFARSVVEFFSVHRQRQPTVHLEGEDHLTGALKRGRGVILMTAHLGNWELAAALLRRRGIPMSAIALPHADARTNRLFTRQRTRCGVATIPLGEDAARHGLARLRQGDALGVLGDREFAGHGISAVLCGRPVVFPRGPAILSLRSRAPIVPLFLIREGLWQFRLCVEPPLQPPSMRADLDGIIRHLTQAFADILSGYLRRAPDQWLMFQSMANGEGRMMNAEALGHSPLTTRLMIPPPDRPRQWRGVPAKRRGRPLANEQVVG